jgi:hypothetical protein
MPFGGRAALVATYRSGERGCVPSPWSPLPPSSLLAALLIPSQLARPSFCQSFLGLPAMALSRLVSMHNTLCRHRPFGVERNHPFAVCTQPRFGTTI